MKHFYIIDKEYTEIFFDSLTHGSADLDRYLETSNIEIKVDIDLSSPESLKKCLPADRFLVAIDDEKQ